MKRLIACYTNAKACSKQIVHASFDDILCGTFRIPTQEEMEQSLKGFIEYEFDEHQTMSKIVSRHPGWSDGQVADETYRIKMRYENEYQDNLRQAAAEAIAEIEQLTGSLKDTIKAWKIKNLE